MSGAAPGSPRQAESTFGDWQKLRLQEDARSIPAGSMPRSIDVIVRGEITESCKPGDKVVVSGTLIVVPEVAPLTTIKKLPMMVSAANQIVVVF